ncbi:nicotinate (nicotinamide) nucleotide adenylyltransferase [bacterium]|nr:nicotinate (nicotinamide) nucleotide adenylyltransferase [bacterium]
MKLCVYFGTFNPIHNAHLAVANYVRNNYDFDVILFVPAYKPPHKEIDDELAHHRLNMVKMAIAHESSYNLSNIEYSNVRFSYTYLTIQELYKRYPAIEGKINFIIGSDAFKEFETWYEAEELKKLIKFIVFPREKDFDIHYFDYLKDKEYDFEVAKLPFIDLSSRVIRSRIKKGKAVTGLLPQNVIEYIKENELYKPKPENEESLENTSEQNPKINKFL